MASPADVNRYICIHGHFYQPPRENPWLEAIERQDSAYPYHDWNERIAAECYAPNYAARILDFKDKIIDIVNNYNCMSFNFGPTLLSWLKKNEFNVYQAILQSDQQTVEKFSGHGSAIAQCYNHMIMPLANARDKLTQITWGIKDFESRFNRKPEGMWLPETAVDLETLRLLVSQGIRYTILAPNQAKRVRPRGGDDVLEVSGGRIDTRRAYRCHLPEGPSIAVFFYNGHISQNVAFGGLLRHAQNFADALLHAFSDTSDPQLVHISTDGETFGHHHKMGDMGLACCFRLLQYDPRVKLTNYGEFLERFPPTDVVEIFENSSWSCVHGIERWRKDCGCNTGGNGHWHQKWRKPLRDALDWLRDRLSAVYEKESRGLIKHPWEARDDYIHIILQRDMKSIKNFMAHHAVGDHNDLRRRKILKLLEMQRHAMLMFTSCGWFFDEVSGIETVQNFYYAARAIQIAQEITGGSIEKAFVQKLQMIPSNIDIYEHGANIYNVLIKPHILTFERVGAHYALSTLFEEYLEDSQIFCFTAKSKMHQKQESNGYKLAFGKVLIRSNITYEEMILCYAVVQVKDYDIQGGVKEMTDDKDFTKFIKEIKTVFKRGDMPRTKQTIEQFFPQGHYSLKHLFKDEQSKILYQILDENLFQIEESLHHIKEFHAPIIKIVKELQIPLPKVLSNTVSVMVNADILRLISSDPIDFDSLETMVAEIIEWSLEIDRLSLAFSIRRRIDKMMLALLQDHDQIVLMDTVSQLLLAVKPLSLDFDFWRSQNAYFSLSKLYYQDVQHKASQGKAQSKDWVLAFERLGEFLNVKIRPGSSVSP